jgi:hypothetical protein
MVRLGEVQFNDILLAGKLLTRLELTDIDQHSSLLQQEICYSRKSFIMQASSFLHCLKMLVGTEDVNLRLDYVRLG